MKTLVLMAQPIAQNIAMQQDLAACGENDLGEIFRSDISSPARALRKLHGYLPLPGYQGWFDTWYLEIEQYDMVIGIAYQSTYRLFKILHKKYPNKRLILYWWDPVGKTLYPDKVNPETCERWTFCKRDAARYGIRYNRGMLPGGQNIKPICNHQTYTFDLSFVGAGDGGAWYTIRPVVLEDLKKICDKQGLSTSFSLFYSRAKGPFALNKRMTGDEWARIERETLAIVDIVHPDECWLTLRTISAMFEGKKVVTNNIDIVHEPFYDANNIFILGQDSDENLQSFLHTPFIPVSSKILEQYSVAAWLNRFGAYNGS